MEFCSVSLFCILFAFWAMLCFGCGFSEMKFQKEEISCYSDSEKNHNTNRAAARQLENKKRKTDASHPKEK